jgi:hypothetical protein
VTQGATVLVANATDVQGAAGRLSQQLRERGFAVSDPTNAAGYEEYLEVTKVYAVPEAEAVARSVALLLGGVPITQMPIPAPIVGATAALGETGVLVMLGADRARIGIPAP